MCGQLVSSGGLGAFCGYTLKFFCVYSYSLAWVCDNHCDLLIIAFIFVGDDGSGEDSKPQIAKKLKFRLVLLFTYSSEMIILKPQNFCCKCIF